MKSGIKILKSSNILKLEEAINNWLKTPTQNNQQLQDFNLIDIKFIEPNESTSTISTIAVIIYKYTI